ncbi:hypothetical protein [Cellvibrio polysaccharolyticus]|uniref:Uncharacterized protein n=1 Tax=Cellvibrio polysaccharolyticus TaxID=2082724 RepID=A0A928V4X0_9GAMM|nr:hypothetical protein [Cellvibrio polysaccharolyticus]MBE8716916.1 hypothetical protein [Cellvibrio polysaccharolyticus]
MDKAHSLNSSQYTLPPDNAWLQEDGISLFTGKSSTTKAIALAKRCQDKRRQAAIPWLMIIKPAIAELRRALVIPAFLTGTDP